MAFWSYRMSASRSGSQGNARANPPQSIEAVRRRARHRLIGAAVLVVLGVIGFSMLFDTQPRPISVDIPIEIPSRQAAPALAGPKVEAAANAPLVEEPRTTAPGLPAAQSLDAREEVVAPARPSSSPPGSTTSAVAAKAEPASKTPATAPATEAARAKALLEGKTADQQPVANQRIVVQVGAFADAARAREVRLKLERAGLKTYTHVAETSEGQRIRVRLGPFSTRAEAEKVAARVKAQGLPAAILTL